MDQPILFSIFLIYFGAALCATLALLTRQSMLIAYILVGMAVGPWGLHLVTDLSFIRQIAQVGIIFLLFLLGMNLQPRELLRFFRETTLVTVLSSLVFCVVGLGLSLLFGFGLADAVIIGLCMMFSSTIIGLKLLPTTALHHQHMGEIMVSVLLLQDIIAIIVLLVIEALMPSAGDLWWQIGKTVCALPLLVLVAFLLSRYLLQALLTRFDRIQEYIFLLAIGWCLGVAELAHWSGLSREIGAFIGGVSLAISPIARFIAERLKPLRDFFLVMFFFSLGASFNMNYFNQLLLPAGVLALSMLLLKPWVFSQLLRSAGEQVDFSRQLGFRLGQISEFSLLIAFFAFESQQLSESAAYLVQITTLLTFIISSYLIVRRYPTPIAVDDKLRND